MNKKIIIFLFLTVLITGFIFSNSLKNSEESNRESSVIVNFIKPIIDDIFGEDVINVNYVVRKGAHLTEFFALGLCVFNLIIACKKKSCMGYGLFYVLMVAVSDEYIQSFSDRTSSVKDVLIDFTGAIIGFLVCIFALWLYYKAKKSSITKAQKGINYGK